MEDDPLDTVLTRAERYVANGERMVARQRMLIEEMDRERHPEAAARAWKLLLVLETSLEVMHRYLETERNRLKRKG